MTKNAFWYLYVVYYIINRYVVREAMAGLEAINLMLVSALRARTDAIKASVVVVDGQTLLLGGCGCGAEGGGL